MDHHQLQTAICFQFNPDQFLKEWQVYTNFGNLFHLHGFQVSEGFSEESKPLFRREPNLVNWTWKNKTPSLKYTELSLVVLATRGKVLTKLQLTSSCSWSSVLFLRAGMTTHFMADFTATTMSGLILCFKVATLEVLGKILTYLHGKGMVRY